MSVHPINQPVYRVTESQICRLQELSKSVGYFEREQHLAQEDVMHANQRVNSAQLMLQSLRGQIQSVLAEAALMQPETVNRPESGSPPPAA